MPEAVCARNTTPLLGPFLRRHSAGWKQGISQNDADALPVDNGAQRQRSLLVDAKVRRDMSLRAIPKGKAKQSHCSPERLLRRTAPRNDILTSSTKSERYPWQERYRWLLLSSENVTLNVLRLCHPLLLLSTNCLNLPRQGWSGAGLA